MKLSKLREACTHVPLPVQLSSRAGPLKAASLRGVGVGRVPILSLALSCQSPCVFVGNMLWTMDGHEGPVNTIVDFVVEHFLSTV